MNHFKIWMPLTCALIFAAGANAQLSFSPMDATQSASAAKAGTLTLDDYYNIALEEIAREAEVRKTLVNSDNLDPCDIQSSNLRLQYANWFKTNFNKFKELENQINEAMDDFKAKHDELRQAVIMADAVEKQTDSEVELSYDKVINFLRKYNKRMSNCKDPAKAALLRSLIKDDPTLNPDGISLEQAETACDKFAKNLNHSLKELKSQYKVELVDSGVGKDLFLTAQIQLKNGYSKSFKVSLLNDADPFSSEGMGKDLRTDMVSFGEDQFIGDYAFSGNIRYLQMYNENIDPICAEKSWGNVTEELLSKSYVPYTTYDHIKSEVERISNSTPSVNQTLVSMSPSSVLMRKYKIEFKATDACMKLSDSTGFHLYAVYSYGKDKSEGTCITSPQIVEQAHDLVVFGINQENNIVAKALSGNVWTALSNDKSTIQLLRAGRIALEPSVMFMNSSGGLKTINIHATIQDSNPLRPSSDTLAGTNDPHLVKLAPGKVCTDKNTFEMRFGEEDSFAGCFFGVQTLKVYNNLFIFGLDANHQLWLRTLYSKWTAISKKKEIARLTAVRLEDGKPIVRFITPQGTQADYDAFGEGRRDL